MPEPSEATGYSKTFSFDEAFRNALTQLPAEVPQHPDELRSVTVTHIGAEFGGIDGREHLVVKLRGRRFEALPQAIGKQAG